MILQIYNNIPGHYEIIESIIVKNKMIIGKQDITKIYLHVHRWDQSFKEYIKKKYPSIEFKQVKNYDFHINCTIYPKHYEMIKKVDNKKYFFIGHDIDMNLRELENVFFLTPLAKRFIYADVMPHMTRKNMNTNIPIYVIQGHFGGTHSRRRNLKLLLKILQCNFEKKFILKFVGTGEIPKEFEPYKDKIQFIQKLNFNDYHKEFLECYAIFTLTLKDTNKQYYKTKLTSTINYIRGYKLKGIIDQDLQDIYKLPDVETYTNENNFLDAFKRSLNSFYKKYIYIKHIKNDKSKSDDKIDNDSENEKKEEVTELI